jgi:uncharacterized protein (UPF0335 family)
MARRPGRPRSSARRNKRDTADQTEASPPATPNTFAPEKVEEVVRKIENLAGEMDTEKSEYMLRCKDIRSDIKNEYDEAREAGITKSVLKAKIKERMLRKKVANCRSTLEPEQIDMFDQVSSALKDIYDDVPRTDFTPPPTQDRPFAQ